MVYQDPSERKMKELAPGVQARSFWGENLMLVLVDFDPNASVPSHHHSHEQAGLVLDGELEFIIGSEKRILKTGDIYFIPSDVEHSAKNGPFRAQIMDIFTPVRQDLCY